MPAQTEPGRDGKTQVKSPESGSVQGSNKYGSVNGSEPSVKQLRSDKPGK